MSITVFVLLAIAVVILRVRYNGNALARTVESALEGNIRGKVSVGSIEWPLRDLPKLVTGGWLDVEIKNLDVFDEYGVQVLHTDSARLQIDVHGAISGERYTLRHVVLDQGGEALIKQVPEPYPAHDYDDSVVSLVSAFYPQRAPSFTSGYSPRRSPTIDLRDFVIGGDGVTLNFDFHDVHATVHKVRGGGFLYYGGSDPLSNKLYYSLATTDGPKEGTFADSADLTIEGRKVKLEKIRVEKLGLLPSRWPAELVPRDIQYRLTADGPGGLKLTLDGAVLDSWIDIFGGEHNLDLRLVNAGKLTRQMSEGRADGENLELRLAIDGPVLAPRLQADVRNLELHIPMGKDPKGKDRPNFDLKIAKAVPSWDLATESGSMKETTATGGDGSMQLAANFQLKPLQFDLDINIPDAIDLAPYLPAELGELSKGTELSGRLSAVGDQDRQDLRELDLTLGQAHVSGQAYRDTDGLVVAKGVNVELLGTRIDDMHGEMNPKSKKLDLDFKIRSNDVARWMRVFKTKPMLRSLSGRVKVGGTLESPTAKADLVATGIPLVNRMEVNVSYDEGELRIAEAESTWLGGWLRASATLLFGESTQIRDLEAQGVNLKLSSLPIIGEYLKGDLDIDIEGGGSTRSPEIAIVAKLSDWSMAGETYQDTTITMGSSKSGEKRLDATLARDAGGVLHVDALVNKASELAGVLSLRDLPMDGLLAHTSNTRPQAGGSLSAELQLGGHSDAPTFEGQVTLLRSWIRRAFLGTADFEVLRVGESDIRITGHVIQRRILIDCLISTKAPYDIDLKLVLRRIELDRFAPDLAAQYGLRGWVSGTVEYQASLGGTTKPTLFAKLTEAEVIAENEDENGRPSPIRLRNRTPLELGYEQGTLTILKKAIIRGPTGDFTLSGSGTVEKLDYHLDGDISVQLVQPYFKKWISEMDGQLIAHATVDGPIDDIRLVGVVEIEDVYIKPVGQDAEVTIPAGKIDFSNSQLTVTGLRIIVDDQFSEDVSEMTVGGGVRLDEFEPTFWTLLVEGRLAGKMLLVLAPEAFSAASGSAAISVALQGAGRTPDFDGTITFDAQTPLSLTPRAARRNISFTNGVVSFSEQDVSLEGIQATVDGEGVITALNGDVSLEDWRPVSVDVTMSARDMLLRLPEELELTVHLNNLEIVGGVDGVEVAGFIEVADGRYIRRFNPVLDALQPTRSTETQTSIFETIPLLGNADLDLLLRTRAFFVDNNVAKLELNGDVKITGTPLKPDFDGVIYVAQGSFKFQGIRARFERTTGSVLFSPGLDFPDQSPYLSIESESDYQSTDGQNHLVALRILGPISKLDVDLSTSAGLNKSQTIQLILSGRSPEDIRETVGDEAVSRRGDNFDNQSTASSEGSFQALDQFTKDIAGDVFALIIEDRLRAATKLDVARLQVGTASIGFYGEKVLTRSWKFTGEIERSISGWNWNLQTKYRLSDGASLDLGYLEKYFDDEADEDESQLRVRGTWRRQLIP
jgi:hypothetical protein